MARINIHVPDKVKSQLETLKQSKETSAGVLERLLAAYQQWLAGQGLHLSPEELEEVQQAVQLSGLSFAEIARQGLLTRARAVKACAEKLKSIDLQDKSQHTRFFGVAAARIHHKVQELMRQGQTITQALISKETNANLKAIKSHTPPAERVA